MHLTIHPVTSENREAALQLSVGEDQTHFIETVKECLEEADRYPAWEPVCIEENGTPVGFAMYGHIIEEKYDRVWFDRFLIDKHYQGHGRGRQAVHDMLDRIRGEFPGYPIYLSVYDDNQPAIALYRSFGFRFNGELDINGEKVMVLDLSR